MAYDNVVINFGSPRSGTTIMHRILSGLHETYASKLHEATRLHPWKSDDGLLDVSQWMKKDTVVFVRTVRHPLAIADSFIALRRDGLRERNQTLQYSNDRIVEVVRAESEGVAAQRDELKRMPDKHDRDHHLVEVRYEDLDQASARDRFVDQVYAPLSDEAARHDTFRRRLHEEWKQRPARSGKLSADIDRAMTDEQMSWFREQLSDVIEREGYR